MRALAVVLMIVCLCGTAPATSPTSPTSQNSVYLELLGNGLLYSLNYDRLITESIGLRVGVSYQKPNSEEIVTVPIMIQYLTGSGNSKLELGIGVCLVSQPDRSSFSFLDDDKEFEGSGALGTATIGYRYQRADEGLVFRAGFTPLFGSIGFWPLAGISIGYGF